jgi:predicted alpha/beta-hydrolase family hydrolase
MKSRRCLALPPDGPTGRPKAERFRIEIAPEDSVTALQYPAAAPARPSLTLILAHGAGAGQTSDFIVTFATALAARGIAVVTFNFLYAERGRRVPDTNARLEAAYRAVIETVRASGRHRSGRLAIGGKSMGGRIASQLAARGAGELAGLVFLGYPLHPPGRPDRLRAAHLQSVEAPMLFIQGSRDAFGTPAELEPIIAPLGGRADLYVVEGGDHSFKLPKSSEIGQAEVYRAMQDRIATWLRRLTTS